MPDLCGDYGAGHIFCWVESVIGWKVCNWLESVIDRRTGSIIEDNCAAIKGLVGQFDMKNSEDLAHHRTSSASLHRDKSGPRRGSLEYSSTITRVTQLQQSSAARARAECENAERSVRHTLECEGQIYI